MNTIDITNESLEDSAKPYDNLIKVCEMVAEDTENDARSFDGKPFNGKTVAEYFGNHGAAIKALSDVLKQLLTQLQK